MNCVFIYGPAASGKLTVATAVSAHSGLPLFHNHLAVDTALSLFEFGSPGFVRLRELIWLGAFQEAALSGRSFIFTFSPESSVPASFIDDAARIVKNAGGRLFYVSLTCRDEIIEERIEAASRSAFRKLASLDQYRQLRKAGAFTFGPLPAPDLTIATDAVSVEDAARQICEFISGRE